MQIPMYEIHNYPAIKKLKTLIMSTNMCVIVNPKGVIPKRFAVNINTR